MASSSSSFHSTPPSSSGSWKYDVFLSFRGTDTRYSFVDHLYSALVLQGIYTYKDDQTLPRGETVSPSLLKAIEKSHIAVIVFSENYADSSWCLQELAHIMKCKDTTGQIVMPIFYHMDPSEVRKQKGKYGEALARHESENKNVESWRKALVYAGNLSGYVVTGPETKFIKQIVATISNRLYASISTDNEELIGIEGRLQDLKSKMEREPDGVLMVGIWGLGGGGKTTLASAIYDEISSKFDGSCFLKDVREESSKHGLEELQGKILSLVLKQKREEIVADVGSLIKSRFRRKKVLIVLDDVDDLDQLKALAGSRYWFGEGSRIIITTRDNHLLNVSKVNVIYNISLLNDNEAYELFCKHALGHGRHIEEYEMLIKDIVSYVGGLPLALKVLGSFLCDKDMSVWTSAMAKLKEIPDSDIVETLKISYDGLSPVEKELFLDIACFFRGEEKDEAMVILDACGYHPMIGVEVLMQNGLITVSEEGRFDMHDLIQDMGRYIVRGENPRNPELHSRVWREEDVAKICSMDATTVMLEENDRIEALQVRFIWDREIPPSLPQVVGNMKKLRWISCLGYPATSLPKEFQPMELCYLQLQNSLIKKLWEGYKLLPNLKVLNLTNSRNLIRTPDFDELPSLERLILRDCASLELIHPSIGRHGRLIFLDMEACRSLKGFPPIIRMKKLETLILTGCFEFCKFPEIQTSMDNLVKLSLSWSGIEVVPSSIGQYCTNLCSLDLRYCYNLVRIEGNFHLLKHLKELYLEGCNQLTNLPTEGLFVVPILKHINPMASSSSSFHSNPPSSSGSWNYDVFLSCRGTDTRKSFVDHLYSALVRQGIYTHKDDQTLPRGETVSPSLLKAIEESHVAVIVFSENYADSSWCLQELAHIMKCKDERGQIVIPIFYHIDPSELRNQKRNYGEALAKHKSKNKNVESWRKALVDAGNLSGFVFTGPETIFIKQIVDTISNRLYASISTDNEELIGIEGRLQDLKSKMEMEPDRVLMVGIWGLGGGGKTTLASALYDEISSKFDGSCFVSNIREESSRHGLPKLQKEILSLVLKLTPEQLVGDVGRLMKSRFHRKRVLMVLDDVDHTDQLKELAGSNAWFGKGSRIIITTRDNHLLKAHKVNMIYNVSLLNENEAIQLFQKHALRQNRPIKDYEILSKDIVSYVGGLPLALKVLGSFLCDKDMSEWTSAMAKLKEIPDSHIVETLKISYDGLKPMEKELFLDIACFFRGEEKDEAMVILDACGYHPMIGVEVLMQKGLITVSEEGRFDMHDLIQEMGHYIVQGKYPRNPELHTRVWQEEDVAKICSMDATTVMLEKNDRIEALQVRFIWDREIPPSLPQVVGNMKKLRWISCLEYPATSLPREFQPMELCYLQLQWSLVEQLWEGYKLLPNLKVLNLTNSRNLTSTPDFDELPSLERLILRDCSSLEEIHPSIGYHERLIFLDMEACRSLKLFPPIVRMKKLETLILTGCFEFCKFPEIQTSMDNLVKLSLSWSGIEVVPSSIGQYCTNLCSLDLRYCYNLVRIEGNFHLLKHLKELYLEGCNQLTNLPTEGLFDVDNCLHLLSLSSTSFNNLQLGAVNEFLGFLPFISRLSLRECSLVDGDISVFCKELSNLQVLDLRENNFSQLHSSLSQLPRLKFLNLSDCYNLVELPDLPSSLAILIAERCTSLNLVADFPTNHLKWLWKVSLSASHCNGERVMQSMFQGNAIEDYFISFRFDGSCIPIRGCKSGTTLQLPWNWYDEFCGFLVYIDWHMYKDDVIIISDVFGRKNDDDDDDDEETITADGMCYISFGSLRNTSWWNSTHTTISFSMKGVSKVELVPRRSQGDDSIERAKGTTYYSEFWDEESSYKKTFEIIRDSRSSIEILFRNNLYEGMFDGM